ncbi:hypothetical protein TELCIR_21579 [Teladorsagia circumcincta]|uniref:Uncharacterized protein n=1 Tax=Teladorsagia circumcincta TaxID=45464 RepID=A0A2G9TGA5_TELCI|nr:hypothetical protein TELCIR_21579 [Teladorsagia circumcincta]
MPDWKVYGEVEPVEYPYFVKGDKTTVPSPVVSAEYPIFNYVL